MAQRTQMTSPYAAKPSSLTDPVPGQEAATQVEDVLAQFEAPQIGAPAGAAPQEQAAPQEDVLGQFATPDAGYEDLSGQPSDMSPLPEPRGLEFAKEAISEAKARFVNSFARSPYESVQTLKQMGLFEDVRVGKGGAIEVRRKGRGGFEKFDRDKVELIGDALDLSRDVLEGVIDVGGTVVGGAIGTAIAGPGPGTVAGAAAGGAASALAANEVGNFAAEQLGVVQDPSRSKNLERALAASMGGVFSAAGSIYARRIGAQKFAQQEAKKTMQYATERVAEAEALVQEVKNSKIAMSGEFRLDPQQAIALGEAPVPAVDEMAKDLAKTEGFQNFRRQQGEILYDAYKSVGEAIGARGGKSGELGKDFVLTIEDITKTEGRLIGDYRKFAKQELVGVPLQANRTVESMQGIVNGRDLMVNPKTGRLQKVSGGSFSDLTERQEKIYIEKVNGVMSKLQKNGGKLTVDDAQSLYTDLTSEINRNIKSATGKPYAYRLIELKNAVRDDWSDMMGKVLPDDMMEEYAKSKARYGELIAAQKNLGNALMSEDLSQKALISKLFEGQANLKQIRAAKTIIQNDNPELWKRLTTGYFDEILAKATDPGTKMPQWSKVAASWNKLDKTVRAEILEGSGIKQEQMDALVRLGVTWQRAGMNFTPKDPGQIGRAIVATAGNVSDVYRENLFTKMFSGIGRDHALMRWLQDGGMELALKDVRKTANPAALKRFENFVANWQPPAPVSKAAKGAAMLLKARTRREGPIDTASDLMSTMEGSEERK